MEKEDVKVNKQAEEMISKLKSMSLDELNQFYSNFKQEMAALSVEMYRTQEGIDESQEKMKNRNVDDDSITKIVFASCFASMIGGMTLGGLFGQNMKEFIGSTLLGTAYGTIFVSLLSDFVFETKPVAKVVNSIKKYSLERKMGKMEKQLEQKQQVHDYLQQVLGEEKTEDPIQEM